MWIKSEYFSILLENELQGRSEAICWYLFVMLVILTPSVLTKHAEGSCWPEPFFSLEPLFLDCMLVLVGKVSSWGIWFWNHYNDSDDLDLLWLALKEFLENLLYPTVSISGIHKNLENSVLIYVNFYVTSLLLWYIQDERRAVTALTHSILIPCFLAKM